MPEEGREPDWSLCTWEGLRRRQRLEFLALPLRRKLEVVEELGEVAAHFANRRRARGLPMTWPSGRPFQAG